MKIEGLEQLNTSIPLKQNMHGDFSTLLTKVIADVNSDLLKAKEAEELLQSGKVQNFIETMATIEKGDISLRFAVELRNKAIEAYQEIMRMQV